MIFLTLLNNLFFLAQIVLQKLDLSFNQVVLRNNFSRHSYIQHSRWLIGCMPEMDRTELKHETRTYFFKPSLMVKTGQQIYQKLNIQSQN